MTNTRVFSRSHTVFEKNKNKTRYPQNRTHRHNVIYASCCIGVRPPTTTPPVIFREDFLYIELRVVCNIYYPYNDYFVSPTGTFSLRIYPIFPREFLKNNQQNYKPPRETGVQVLTSLRYRNFKSHRRCTVLFVFSRINIYVYVDFPQELYEK